MTQPSSSPWGDPGSEPTHARAHPYGQVDDAPDPGPAVGGHAPRTHAAPGGYGGYPPPDRPTSPALGRVALGAGLLALIGSVVNALIIGALFRPDAFESADGGNFAVLMSLGLANVLLVWFGFGLWAIIQGGIAIAQKRGVAAGVGAVILGIVGPWTGVMIAAVAVVSAFADV